jgi:uncharacterized protein (TIGR03435 family)
VRVGLVLIAAAGIAWPQDAFEVATVKPSPPDHVGAQVFSPAPGRFTALTATLKDLVAFAFRVHRFQVSGGQGWMDSTAWDITAKSEVPAPVDQLRLMVQALLRDRFQLTVHRETKERSAYALVAGKNGPRLKEVAQAGLGVGLGRSQLKGRGATMPVLASVLSDRLDRAVLDQTGLKGFYEFTLEWASDDAADATGPSLFTAMEEQLGLKLEPSKGAVETIVIDRAERSSAN